MSPVSKRPPLSAVAVCAVVSLFLTVTLDPAGTVSVAGANLKLLMSIVFAPPAFGAGFDELEVGAEEPPLPPPPPPPPPPQPPRTIAAATMPASERLD